MSAPDALDMPSLPRDEDGPVFAEPWQAQAFALTIRLHEEGAFTWPEWALALSDALTQAPAGRDYYECWLGALEKVVVARGLLETSGLEARKEAWAEAYRRTPHGQPIEL